ncbi:MAG TPA: histidine kinase [Roseiflexaceae bacterium]|nr:histidine kinase [Roseiflexaceae bacterium]
MSGTRPNPHPWLADHVIFFGYRWLSWGVAAVWLLLEGRLLSQLGWVLLATAALNIPATLYAQRYVRVARRNPALLVLDMLYGAFVLVQSGGWESAFVAHSYGSLVLPGLLFGWRGGVIAGLAYVPIDLSALWAAGMPVSDQLVGGVWPPLEIGLRMALPPLFGGLLPLAVELLRQRVGRRARARSGRSAPPPDERFGRGARPELARYAARSPAAGGAEQLPGESPLATQAIRTRTAERGVEELRRVIFAPLPTPDMDLAAALDLLALRFGQHTGAATRVTLLGRTRAIHHVHRNLLVRLAQEALLNVQQHAHAASAMITLRYDATSVALLIQDDGVGLLDGTHERPGLHALRALQYRLAECGGRLDVFETEGGGVTVRATMPLE